MMPALPPELQRVHMVGIGGAGMSGIARILLDRGGQVSGSNAKESRGVRALQARGAQIRIGHDASALDQLDGGVTAVITTHAAIPKTNPELVEARRRGIPVVLRPAVLAKLMAGRTTLMVTGTHGKTTTTSMLIVALQHCGRDPSFAVGGELGEAGTNAHHGSGDCFVAEADESDGSLLEYTPNVAVVTNIEADHLDFFGSSDAYIAVFDSFAERIAPGGALVVCTDDPGAAALADRIAALGIRVKVFDDYAHHPTEVAATLEAVRTLLEQAGTGRSLVVFQPHLYSRTQAFAAEFGAALDGADQVFVLDVYGAREQPIAGVSGASIAEHVSVPSQYVPDFSAVAEAVAAVAEPGDVVVTMGAGDVTMLAPEIVTALRMRANRSAPGRPGAWR